MYDLVAVTGMTHGRQNHINLTRQETANSICTTDLHKLNLNPQPFSELSGKIDFITRENAVLQFTKLPVVTFHANFNFASA
jgi:hypothetical protein